MVYNCLSTYFGYSAWKWKFNGKFCKICHKLVNLLKCTWVHNIILYWKAATSHTSQQRCITSHTNTAWPCDFCSIYHGLSICYRPVQHINSLTCYCFSLILCRETNFFYHLFFSEFYVLSWKYSFADTEEYIPWYDW